MRLKVDPSKFKITFQGEKYSPVVLDRPLDLYAMSIPFFIKMKCVDRRIPPNSIIALKKDYVIFYYYSKTREVKRLYQRNIEVVTGDGG